MAVGKWETCFWFSTFPSAFVVDAVGMWESRLLLARFPRAVERVGSLRLAFHAFHSPAFPQLSFAGLVSGRAAPHSLSPWLSAC